MKKVFTAIVGAAVFSMAIASVATPALALGGCGPNGHRGPGGHCVFGGQNQAWCMRTKGHPAVRMPDGTLRCI